PAGRRRRRRPPDQVSGSRPSSSSSSSSSSWSSSLVWRRRRSLTCLVSTAARSADSAGGGLVVLGELSVQKVSALVRAGSWSDRHRVYFEVGHDGLVGCPAVGELHRLVQVHGFVGGMGIEEVADTGPGNHDTGLAVPGGEHAQSSGLEVK